MEYKGIKLTIHSQQKHKTAFLMKNMVYCFICNLLLVALLLLTSCGRRSEEISAGKIAGNQLADSSREFLVTRQPQTLYGKKRTEIHFTNAAGHDTSAAKSVMAGKSQKDLIRWAESGGM